MHCKPTSGMGQTNNQRQFLHGDMYNTHCTETNLTDTWGLCTAAMSGPAVAENVDYQTSTSVPHHASYWEQSQNETAKMFLHAGIAHGQTFQTWTQPVTRPQSQSFFPQQPVTQNECTQQEFNMSINMSSPFTEQCSEKTELTPLRRSPRKSLALNAHNGTAESTESTPLRRSPRKSLAQNFLDNSESESSKQTLLKQYPDVKVDGAQVSKACSSANKSDKPGYRLCYLLLRAVFSDEELAMSGGQGLTKPKAGDYRPILDKTKMDAIKDYTRRWCRKNERPVPAEAEMNNAVTEQIHFCRKKLQHK